MAGKSKTTKTYVDANGAEVKKPNEAAAFAIAVHGHDDVLQVSKSDYPAEIQDGIFYFGLSTRLGNKIGGSNASPSEMFDEIAGLHELMVAGDWSEAKAGGPRLGLLVEAIVAAYAEDGKEVETEAVKAKLVEGGDALRKQTMDNPKVQVHYTAIQAAKAAERAKAAKAAAKTADVGLDLM